METPTNKTILTLLKDGGVSALLAAILIYFGGQFLTSITSIQADLANIKMELVKIQASIVTQEHVKEMIEEKIKLLQYKYHNNK